MVKKDVREKEEEAVAEVEVAAVAITRETTTMSVEGHARMMHRRIPPMK